MKKVKIVSTENTKVVKEVDKKLVNDYLDTKKWKLYEPKVKENK